MKSLLTIVCVPVLICSMVANASATAVKPSSNSKESKESKIAEKCELQNI